MLVYKEDITQVNPNSGVVEKVEGLEGEEKQKYYQSGYVLDKSHIGANLDYDAADNFCLNHSVEGYDDWELPSIKLLEEVVGTELSSLIEDFKPENTFWSSTPDGQNMLTYGKTNMELPKEKHFTFFAFCVRKVEPK